MFYFLSYRDMDAFISTSAFMELEASKIDGCPFVILTKPISTFVNALAFPKGSKWKHPFSELILKYQRKDFFRKLSAKWFENKCEMGPNRTKKSSRLSFENVSGLFIVCAVTIAVCLVYVAMETLLYHLHNYTRKNRRTSRDKEVAHVNEANTLTD